MVSHINFTQMLSGPDAFYNQKNYESITKKDMASPKALKPSYTYNTEHKVWRVVKEIFSILFFPLGLYRLLHSLAGKVGTLPASTPQLMGLDANYADKCREDLNLKGKWKVKRFSVEVDGFTIDAAIMGKAETLGNGRWVLSSNGNGEFYEQKLKDQSFKQILSEVDGNAIVFNYPGVGASSGMPNRDAMVKAYRAMLNLLEDQQNGIGAKEIIGYGHSIGGAVQAEGLLNHKLKEDVKYVFIKSRTFTDLSSTASLLMSKPMGFVVKALSWNMDCVKSSKKLKAPEIIMQTAEVTTYSDIAKTPELIKDDGIIAREVALAKKLIEDKTCPKKNKTFMGIPEGHNSGVFYPQLLGKKINEILESLKDRDHRSANKRTEAITLL